MGEQTVRAFVKAGLVRLGHICHSLIHVLDADFLVKVLM